MFAPLALVLVVLFLVRARLHRRLHAISQRVASPRSDRFSLTLAALALTLAIALPWPLLVRLIAWRLGAQTGTSEFVKAVGVALAAVSAIWMLLAATRAFCLPGGIADAHFHWRGPGLRPLRRNVLVLLAIVAPLVFLIVLFAAQGRTEWHNSVGRIAFVAAQLALAWFMASALRPHGDLVRGMLERRRGGWLDRLRYIWYGSVMLLPVALALLAASGWYYTAQKLYLRFQSSILLFVFTLVISAGCTRGLFVLRRRMALQKAETRTAEGQDPEKDEMDIDLSAVSREARRLTTSFTALAIFLGLWLIWSDVFPALTFMDRPLWTSTAKVAVETAEGTSTVVEQPQAVTIADMALGIVIVIMTLIAGKNLPGLLRLTILQRLPLERGVLFALTAISRYAITATGLVIAFGAIGISWASVQWLVAAATVGLGFGLQEIFANFVSGLIILFERPMRVGDTVTVGSVTGIVTRIRIRATTITDWDRKELIVPNKEFVTGQLVNWTLSDSILRVVVPVGVSYGTDVDLACQTMLRVARENPLVMRDPAPSVLFRQFGDSSLNFDLRAYVADFESYLPVLNDLHMCITKAFRQAGIEIPFPQRDLHVRSVSYDLPVRIQRGPGGTEDAGETTGGG